MAGDTLIAGTAAARIRFVDGTMVTLSPRSKITVQQKAENDDLSLRLVNGFMTFTLAPSSSLSVYSGNTPVPALPGVTATASTAQVRGSGTDALPAGLPPSLSRH
jgi:ferric-dicitrate binding protein FerR (iron transport regulator)